MTKRSFSSPKQPGPATTSFLSPRAGLLQRKCACGGTGGPTGECAECGKKRLQRNAWQSRGEERNASDVPAIVHEVLRSAGRPLEAETRDFMETQFGHDFSRVRIHTDADAAESARVVNAQAFTVGSDIVFGSGQYTAGSQEGNRLLAHELAHTLQRAPGHADNLEIAPAASPAEAEADRLAGVAMNPVSVGPLRASAAPTQQLRRQLIPVPNSPVPLAGPYSGYNSFPPPGVVPPKASGAPTNCGSMKVNMKPFVTGVEGTIEFNPDPKTCPKCGAIRLVQIVRVFEKPGQEYIWTGGEAPREQVKTKEDKAKGVKAGYFVDHQATSCSKGKACSLYYRDHWPNPSVSQDGSNDGTTAKTASLWDRPEGDADDVYEFETCAKCADNGADLRCVDWGWQADGAGKVTLTPTSEHAQPSATFSAATSAFKKYYK